MSLTALALDLDGTLTCDDNVSDETRQALRAARTGGLSLILVSGRTGEDLRDSFPGLTDYFDAVVTDNGGMVHVGPLGRRLGRRIDDRLCAALDEAGIAYERGECLLSCDAQHAATIAQLIGDLGLHLQVFRNRSRLMVMSPGVTKANGLLAALHRLGLSRHNLVAVGDAENDLDMLTTAELSVAVANAVGSVKEMADVVLDEENGRGVCQLLQRRRGSTWPMPLPERHDIVIGHFADGDAVRIPVSTRNILIQGESGAGKSYMAGLLIEKWSERDYRSFIVDVEGDYLGLQGMCDVVVFGGSNPPDETVLSTLLRWGSQSVVVDLSVSEGPLRTAYLREVPSLIGRLRSASGMPHWVVIDEAHATLGPGGVMEGALTAADSGYIFVTYRPSELPSEGFAPIDVVITALGTGTGTAAATIDFLEGSGPRSFVPAARETSHLRHGHKYAVLPLCEERWFRFTRDDGEVVAVARNLGEFAELLLEVPVAVVERHIRRGDLQLWLAGFDSAILDQTAQACSTRGVCPRRSEPDRACRLAEVIAHLSTGDIGDHQTGWTLRATG